MANINSYRKARWLRKEDVSALSAAQRRTVIDRIVDEEVGDDTKPVCYLRGIDKGWPINMTALETLAEHSKRDDTEAFAGIPVEVYVDPSVTFQGQRVGGIKLRPLAKPAPRVPATPPAGNVEIEDDINFAFGANKS